VALSNLSSFIADLKIIHRQWTAQSSSLPAPVARPWTMLEEQKFPSFWLGEHTGMLSDRQPAKWANHYPNTSYLKLQTKENTMVYLNHHIPLCYKYTQNQCVQLPQAGCLQQKLKKQKGVQLCQLTLCSVYVTSTVKSWLLGSLENMALVVGKEGEAGVWLYPWFALALDGGGWLTHALSQGMDPATIANYSSIQCYIFGLGNLKEKSTYDNWELMVR